MTDAPDKQEAFAEFPEPGETTPQEGESGFKLPEKFKTPEDLYKSYQELERKLGERQTPETPTEDPKSAKADVAPPTNQITAETGLFSVEEMGKFAAELSQGALTEDSVAALAKRGVTPEMAELFYEGQRARGQRELEEWMDSQGGVEELTQAKQWGLENWQPESIQAWETRLYDAVSRGDHKGIQRQYEMLLAQFKADRDTYPSTSVRGGSYQAAEPIGSQAEMVALMDDPRYRRGEKAYVTHVQKRIAASKSL